MIADESSLRRTTVGFKQSKNASLLTILLLSGTTLLAGCSSTSSTSETDTRVEHQQSASDKHAKNYKEIEAPAVQKAPISGDPITAAESLADFDAAWKLVNDTHFDPEFNGVDWGAMRERYRPQAASAKTRQESRAVITAMLDTLGQSHFGIIPKEASDEIADDAEIQETHSVKDSDRNGPAVVNKSDAVADGDGDGNADIGINILIIDGQAVVSEVRPGGPADLAGIRTGWIVSKIRNTPIARVIESLTQAVGEDLVGIYGVGNIEGRLQGREGSEVRLTLLDAKDQEKTYTLTRESMPGEAVVFGNLPPMQTSLEWGWYDSERYNLGDKKIGYIDFTIWMMPIVAQFEEAMIGLQDADGIVIDLRGNPGGVGGMAPALARYFVSEKASLGTMTMRGQSMTFNVSPIIVTRSGERLAPFDGPVAIILDQGSASTSEFFAGGMQAIERVEVFGTRSAGMALAAAMDKLPSGDVLLHAISDYVTAKGNAIEATGVIPEHPIPANRADLLNGIDAPAQAAIEWIKYSE
jgi:carboxyl-terminal processing protease